MKRQRVLRRPYGPGKRAGLVAWGAAWAAVALLGVFGEWPAALAAEAKPAGAFEIPAWTFDRGNATIFANPDIYADYRDKFPDLVLGAGEQSSWVVGYDVEFPVDATYTLRVRYGSPEPRPLDVWLDGRRVGQCCGRATGNAPPYLDRHPQHERPRYVVDFHGLEWEDGCRLRVSKGKHTLKLTCQGPPPRLNILRLESPVAFPPDWKPGQRRVNLDRVAPRYRRMLLPPDSVNVATLRMAIENTMAEFGPRYSRGAQYLKRLAELESRQRAARGGTPKQQEKIEAALKSLEREALLAHPLLKFERLLFVTQIHRGVSIYTGHLAKGSPGGNLCVLSPVSPEGKVTKLVPELEGGVFGRFDLSFDATKVVFCYAEEDGHFRIYEIDIDPTTGRRVGKLRQLTFDSDEEAETERCYEGSCYGKGYDDTDPCYLPDGRIMFASTRARHAVLCFPATATTLHVMDADGRNIRCISSGQVNELAPCLLDDGRVIYTRWEYVDKGFTNVQSLWAVRPDGSGSEHIYKNTLVRPATMLNARSIPGSLRLVTIGAGHHGGLAGPVLLVDTRRERRTARAMINLTPEISLPGMYPMKSNGGFFREPYPLSEKLFLVAHNPTPGGEPKRFGLYVLDAWGNRAALYEDAELSCYQPIPLRARPRPTQIPSAAELFSRTADAARPVGTAPAAPAADARQPEGAGQTAREDATSGTEQAVHQVAVQVAADAFETAEPNQATLLVQDVYEGLTGIERGRVKYLRVMEAMNLSWHDAWRAGRQGDGAGQQASAVSLGADVAIKKIHGIVSVHEDGSALFTVPAETNVYFQVLDEDYMELQRMRTFINLMPGEKRSCVGCHEVRRRAPRLGTANLMALEQPPQPLRPQPGDSGPRTVHYALDVQPILDRHCTRCHSGPQPKAELDLTGELTEKFSRSYENLLRGQLVSYLEGGFGSANVPAELPLTFGSHQSPLVQQIRRPPCQAGLTREEFIRIVTWIDANVPYYGTHQGKKNLKWKDEPDFRPVPLAGK